MAVGSFSMAVDSCRRENVNRKDLLIVEPDNPAVEREFGGHVPWIQGSVLPQDQRHATKSRGRFRGPSEDLDSLSRGSITIRVGARS